MSTDGVTWMTTNFEWQEVLMQIDLVKLWCQLWELKKGSHRASYYLRRDQLLFLTFYRQESHECLSPSRVGQNFMHDVLSGVVHVHFGNIWVLGVGGNLLWNISMRLVVIVEEVSTWRVHTCCGSHFKLLLQLKTVMVVRIFFWGLSWNAISLPRMSRKFFDGIAAEVNRLKYLRWIWIWICVNLVKLITRTSIMVVLLVWRDKKVLQYKSKKMAAGLFVEILVFD